MDYEAEYNKLLSKHDHFKKQVASMRNAQNAYFASRSKTDLSIAKTWEYKIDQAINEKIINQLKLF